MTRTVPASMTAAWLSPNKTGPNRPIVRATVQRQRAYRFDYDTAYGQGGDLDGVVRDRHRTGYYTTLIFGEDAPLRELPNIIDFTWDRSVGQDAATATMTLLNTAMVPVGAVADASSALDKAGFLTYNRGDDNDAVARWDHELNGWHGILVPDVVIKTYEGYGCDTTVMPAQDGHLLQSGLWMVDKVTYTDDGAITVEMRDLARILLDEVCFPPVIPIPEYPLTWVRNHTEQVPGRDCKGGRWMDRLRRIGTAGSSNNYYIGLGFTNAPYPAYVGSDGSVEGHKASHAIGIHNRGTPEEIEADTATYWRSTGQDAISSKVWWEITFDSRTPVGAVRIRPLGGPFRVYISVHNGTRWMGKKKIPYQRNGVAGTPGNVDIEADIPFVMTVIADRFFSQDYTLPRKYRAKKIRLTFSHLREWESGEHPWRAGLREFQIYTADDLSDLRFERGTVQRLVGNYADYTDIIKWVTAWAGWFWPPHSTGMDFIRVQPGGGSPPTKDWVTFQNADPRITKGRVWGDFMRTGTGGIADLTVDLFDKKPLMDIINYVRDIVGFLFFIDETGGVIWRLPNLGLGGSPRLGNYLSPNFTNDGRPGNRGRGGRTTEIVTLDEETTLLGYSTTLDSRNIRERIFVANAVGGIGTVIKGFNPYPIGLMRVAGWSDQNFKTKREVKVMASLIAVQQMFSYKRSTATTPGYPKLQIDDQIRIYERVTGETGYHYIEGIRSTLNMAEGSWTYDLTTHWLGKNPSDAWAVRAEQLDAETQQYLAAIGYTPSGAADNDSLTGAN